jgi:2'-5' RNA ligase
MALAIIAQLSISDRDRAWIDALRPSHDPQAGMVAPHVTLVFPFEGPAEAEALAHAADVAGNGAPVAFRLDRLVAVRDPLGPRNLLFLTPGQGAAEIRALHAALYGGPLRPQLRRDIVYAPHVTVGAFADHAQAEAAVAAVRQPDIEGFLRALDLVAFDGRTVALRQRLPLGAG